MALILIADDDELAVEAVCDALSDRGFLPGLTPKRVERERLPAPFFAEHSGRLPQSAFPPYRKA